MKPHLGHSVLHAFHLLHAQYGDGPTLVHHHFQLSGVVEIDVGRGYGDALVCRVKVAHALHHAFAKQRSPVCFPSVHPQLSQLHHAVAGARSLSHPHLALRPAGQTAVVGQLPSRHRQGAAYHRLLALPAANHRGRFRRSAVLRPHIQRFVHTIHTLFENDVDASLHPSIIQPPPFAGHFQRTVHSAQWGRCRSVGIVITMRCRHMDVACPCSMGCGPHEQHTHQKMFDIHCSIDF